MQDFMYSTVSAIAIVIHILLNMNDIRRNDRARKRSASYRKGNVSYLALMFAIFVYYITDACWGLFAGLEWTAALFADTTIYFLAMAGAVVSWCIYIIEYLRKEGIFARVFRWIGITFFVLECVFLVANFFIPIFFWFDGNGAYQSGAARYAVLWVQVIMFASTVFITGMDARKSEGMIRKRYMAIFFFSLTMVLFNILQIMFPLFPFYATGCLIGTCIMHVYVLEDEREEARETIAQEKENAENASRAKTSFLFNMSHDIRTPMNAIIGYTAMAKKHTDDPEKTADCLEKIEIAGNQLLSLVNQVLEMSRIESGKIVLNETKVNLPENIRVFRAIYEGQAALKDIRLETPAPEIVHENVIADNDRPLQILNNVTGNALKYTMAGGTVTLKMKELPCQKEGYGLYIMSVQDTGIGMSEEFLKTVFDEFSRENTSTVSKIQGTGLGMSIVKKLTELMGGTVEIQSVKGKGTTVTIALPLKFAAEPEKESEKKTDTGHAALKGMKILLAEDNEMNREIATEILEEYGIEVTAAEDGDIAVDKVMKAPAGTYDLILMDIQMPRMNGYEATKAIRSLPDLNKAAITIIAMTANAFEEDRRNALAAGMNAHLAKPIDIQKLEETLMRFKKE